jgi:predicted nucleic acid-binding protein
LINLSSLDDKELTLNEFKPIIGKICSKCNIDKPKDSFHNNKYKECVKVSNDKESSDSLDQNSNIKHIIDINHMECTICNKIISKTNSGEALINLR